jgi:hypothetical protein
MLHPSEFPIKFEDYGNTSCHETEVHLDFHIYAILDFDHLIGYPLKKNFFKSKSSNGSLDEKLGTTASASHIPSFENPKAK